MQLKRLPNPRSIVKVASIWRLSLTVLTVGALLLSVMDIGAADRSAELPINEYEVPKVLRFAMVEALGGVNPKDAMVAIDLHWSRHLANMFPKLDSQFEFLPDEAAAARRIEANRLHGLSLGVTQFLKLQEDKDLNPVFISSRQSQPLESYLLLVRQGSDWPSLNTQTVKRLITEKMDTPNIGRMWLETLLKAHDLPQSHDYFTQISAADKPARIILPVFFGQADACLVPESAYRTMVELNPQINTRLTILERSPGFIKTIHCTTNLMPEHMVDRFIKDGIRMDDTVHGRQLLLIFHVKKNFPYRPEYLTDSQKVFRRYHQIVH